MYLKKLSLINFKNIREENLEFRPGINCFVGDNGAGKTLKRNGKETNDSRTTWD